MALQNAPVYQQLIQELRQVETEIATELTRFQPGSLAIQVLQEKREQILPVIDAEAQRVLEAKYTEARNNIELLETQNQTIAIAEAQLQNTLTQLPTLAREYSDLQRELDIAVGALNRFLETRETLQIEAAQTEIPWELIEAPSKPEVPISPNTKRSLMLGIVASLLVSVGAALLLEKLDTVCRTVEEIKGVVKLPLLGTIPYQPEFDTDHNKKSGGMGQWLQRRVGKKDSLATDGYYGYSGSQFLESMRLLQTNLSLMGADRPIRSVILSSSMPNEGKSTVARHLAQTAATMGKRVLLVDADLRRPTVHHQLGISNEKGLSDLLSGNATGAEVFKKAMPFVDFYAMTAGTIPPDPVKLLASRRMRLLMNQLAKQFDLVVYDTPPLVGLADATLIASHTDGLILVSRVNKCDRNILQHAMDNINFTKVPVLGLVANGVSSNGQGYKYYSYGYESQPGKLPQPNPDLTNEGAKVLAATASTNGKSPHKNGLTISDVLKARK